MKGRRLSQAPPTPPHPGAKEEVGRAGGGGPGRSVYLHGWRRAVTQPLTGNLPDRGKQGLADGAQHSRPKDWESPNLLQAGLPRAKLILALVSPLPLERRKAKTLSPRDERLSPSADHHSL